MTVTLDNLIYAVRLRLGDHVQEGYDTATGDGETDRFALTHQNLLADSCSVTVGGVADSSAQVDELSGWVRFTSVPADTAEIAFSYQYTIWSDERITEAVNASIHELFGRFYLEGFNEGLWSEGGAEFIAQENDGTDLDPDDRITKLEYWDGARWRRTDRWHVATQGETKVVIFENTPATGVNFRITYHKRLGELVATSDTLEDIGLRDRAKEPLVLYACADLITDRIHHRIRDDRGHNTQSENPVKSYEIQNDANYLRQLAELKASRLKQPTVGPRISY